MDRVFLRPLEPKDVNPTYLSWFADDTVTRFLEVDGKSLNVAKVVDYITHGRETKSYYMYAICLRDSLEHIGNLKLGPIDHKSRVADLVAVIGARAHWGKGLATEAIKQGNELAFREYKLRKLSGSIYSGNIGSVKAYTKAGWVIEGTRKHHFEVNGEYQDEVFVSCFNPAFHPDQVTLNAKP